MVHYWGANAIQQRMGVKSLSGLRGLIAREHLPVYRRIRKLPGIRPRRVLYTNDVLLTTWELGQVRLEVAHAQALMERKNQVRKEAREALRRGAGEPAPTASLAPVVTPAQFVRVRNKQEPQT